VLRLYHIWYEHLILSEYHIGSPLVKKKIHTKLFFYLARGMHMQSPCQVELARSLQGYGIKTPRRLGTLIAREALPIPYMIEGGWVSMTILPSSKTKHNRSKRDPPNFHKRYSGPRVIFYISTLSGFFVISDTVCMQDGNILC
jgi:hypothetical protein